MISENLVRLMEGHIEVHSELGKGSEFTVTLPVKRTTGENPYPDVSGLSILAFLDESAGFYAINSFVTHLGSKIERIDDLEDLKSRVKTAEKGTIVLLATETAEKNTQVRQYVSRKDGKVRFLSASKRRGDANLCVLPDCFAIDRYPLLPGEFVHALAVLAGRASPDVEHLDVFNQSEPSPSKGEGRLILLVEDNEPNQEVISMQVNLLGHGVVIAENGVEGLEKWKSGDFDLVLSDCHMPVMDGFQMTGALRQHERANDLPRSPVIAITANALQGWPNGVLRPGWMVTLPNQWSWYTYAACWKGGCLTKSWA